MYFNKTILTTFISNKYFLSVLEWGIQSFHEIAEFTLHCFCLYYFISFRLEVIKGNSSWYLNIMLIYYTYNNVFSVLSLEDGLSNSKRRQKLNNFSKIWLMPNSKNTAFSNISFELYHEKDWIKIFKTYKLEHVLRIILWNV